MADEGKILLFGRIATRVYAASSDLLNPGVEDEPAAKSEAFLGWWNDHYEEVAQYEPEYQRLNEIMKWSLLISWLNKDDNGKHLRFLAAVEVERDKWFPNWIRQQSNLKFSELGQNRFFLPWLQGPNNRVYAYSHN